MAHQVVVDLLLVLEGVVAEASLVSYQGCYFLSVVASHNGVVESDLIVGAQERIWILVVELDHFNGVGECVERQIDTFSDGDELVLRLCNSVAGEGGNRFEKLLQLLVFLQILGRDTGHLHVEELGGVEHGLLLFSLPGAFGHSGDDRPLSEKAI